MLVFETVQHVHHVWPLRRGKWLWQIELQGMNEVCFSALPAAVILSQRQPLSVEVRKCQTQAVVEVQIQARKNPIVRRVPQRNASTVDE
jgi:hypothetical protein